MLLIMLKQCPEKIRTFNNASKKQCYQMHYLQVHVLAFPILIFLLNSSRLMFLYSIATISTANFLLKHNSCVPCLEVIVFDSFNNSLFRRLYEQTLNYKNRALLVQ